MDDDILIQVKALSSNNDTVELSQDEANELLKSWELVSFSGDGLEIKLDFKNPIEIS